MTMSVADQSLIPHMGRIERALSNARFQRWFGLCASILGLLCIVGTIIGMIFIPEAQYPGKVSVSLSTAAGFMKLLAACTALMLVFVAGMLGLYLSARSSESALARLLGTSCSAMAAGFGIWAFNVELVVPLAFEKTSILKKLELMGSTGDALLIAWFLLLFFIVLLLTSVWMFSSLKFILYFPKPVKLAGIDPHATSMGIGDRIRARWRTDGLFGVLVGDLRGLTFASMIAPQFVALALGMGLIGLVDYQADLWSNRFFANATFYFWCWIPFAFISGKQKHLGEDDRRATRWVALGQAIWLVVFLGSLLLVLAMRASGLLTFSSWQESNVFTSALMNFTLCGFVLVFLATLAFSILYHGTLDPDLMIRRTWVTAVVGVSSGVLFVLVERFAATMLTRLFDISAGTSFTLVGMFTAACIFPIRAWAEKYIKRLIDKWHSAYSLADGVREDAVIVFADLSGYTALTEKNEREALILAAIFHLDAETVAETYRGRLIKTIGDAVLMRFAKTDDAYAAIRKLIADYVAHAAPLVRAPLPVHAAVHRGEIVAGANGDVFGATVNLAARLLGVAGPHEVVASESAISGLSAQFKAELIGSRVFKNIEQEVPCFRLGIA